MKEAAASCFMELLKYASSVDHSLRELFPNGLFNTMHADPHTYIYHYFSCAYD